MKQLFKPVNQAIRDYLEDNRETYERFANRIEEVVKPEGKAYPTRKLYQIEKTATMKKLTELWAGGMHPFYLYDPTILPDLLSTWQGNVNKSVDSLSISNKSGIVQLSKGNANIDSSSTLAAQLRHCSELLIEKERVIKTLESTNQQLLQLLTKD